MLQKFIAALNAEPITPTAKGLPQRAYGRSVAEFLATRPTIEEFWTPLVVIDEEAMAHNIDLLARWSSARDLQIMPHGKTMMAPALWQRQLDAGAAGITLATLGQVRMGREAGLRVIQLANQALDPSGLAWLADELADEAFSFTCWVDSIESAQHMDQVLAAARAPRPVTVLVELGVPGGRTGARSIAAARQVAEHVARSRWLRLGGVSGYEGVLGAERTGEIERAVASFLAQQVELHHGLADLYDDGPPIVTAGGSGFFDHVATAYADGRAGAPANTAWVIRSGAYLTHDEGHYQDLSPLGTGFLPRGEALRPALAAYARIQSAPEPGLAIADAGKRDVPYDIDLPVLTGYGHSLSGPFREISGHVTALNDQHAFVATAEPLEVGAVLRLGLSHPCTTFDKWVYLPVVAADGRVIDLVRTFF